MATVVQAPAFVNRRRAIGAEVVEGSVHFRVWAPSRNEVAAVIEGRDVPLAREGNGYFSGLVAGATAGTRYRFRLDGEDETFPDPASRFQPDGVHGPSEVIDPTFVFRHWDGIARGRVLYELHVGTFTPEGTYAAAMQHLPFLAAVGINVLELMPVHEFPGEFGWGYDGVDLWAPTRLYGTPDDLRRFVDQAHAHGIAVILDVVYNHFGPDGCYLKQFSPDYFTDRYENEWGEAVNFDGANAQGVRTFVCENAAYWIDEFHFDGLRIDATQSIFDSSERNILTEIAAAVRAAARGRRTFVVAENEPQDRAMVREHGLDAMWNDDWHHAALVAMTGNREAYYTDYLGTPQEFVSMAKLGFLYQGQWYSWQKNTRGTSSIDFDPSELVVFLQNHDQLANTARGERVYDRAMTAYLLLQPQTPMLFQGQEFEATAPFLYFADHKPGLAEQVAKGRREFLQQFPSLRGASLPLPHDPATFTRCKLDHSSKNAHEVRELLRLRREMPFHERMEGAVLGPRCWALRWFGDDPRLLLVNLGDELTLEVADSPLLAGRWRVLYATGAFEEWTIGADSAALLGPADA
jgi:maltooligosyltrehalose trehalohydrolase